MPLAWTKGYTGDESRTSRVFCTTMGAASDLVCTDLRRLLVNAAHWCVDQPVDEDSCVDIVGTFDPTFFGFSTHQQGRRPSDYA
jgi:hypothetical protein